jgi:hypothetical protein
MIELRVLYLKARALWLKKSIGHTLNFFLIRSSDIHIEYLH